jgi:FkbM family methyltransferase
VRSARARARAGAALKRAGQRMGVEIRRHRPFGLRRARLLAERGVEMVIDVGANRGQYAEELRRHGYRGRIVSFEPLSEAYAALQRRSATDERWQVQRLALSDGDRGLFPEAVPPTLERVRAARLDEVELDLPPPGRTLLKLDVQGYELRVLTGAAGMLGDVGIVETELSVVALYEGQPLLADILRALEDERFALHALEPILRDWRTGELLQFDGLFVRR